MKPIRLSGHARSQLSFRGATEEEIINTIQSSPWVLSQLGRLECVKDFPFGREWNKKQYPTKRIRPIFVEEEREIVVITVYTYYF
jgi:hypothetical protein